MDGGGGGEGMQVEVPLSTGALKAMWREHGLRPVLQLADEPRMAAEAGPYRVALSDGGERLQPGVLGASLNRLVVRGELRRGTVVRVLEYFAGFYHNQRVIIVIQLEILHAECTLIRSPTIFEAKQQQTGLGRNPDTGDIEAEPEIWETQEGAQPQDGAQTQHGAQPDTVEAVAPRGKPPRHLDLLEALYGDRNRNTGTFMSAGGVREVTPPPGLFQSPPSTYHSGSKRALDQAVTSPRKPEAKKSCDIGEYMARLSESIHARSTYRERERRSEVAEVNEMVAMLEFDGVEEGSDLKFEAMELFLNPMQRHYYKHCLKNSAERVAWLKWQVGRKERKSD